MAKKEVIKAVTEQLINMLYNNTIEENGAEGFVGWCEDGEVFALNEMSEDDVESCMDLVNEISPLVDKLSCQYLNLDFVD